MKMAWLALVACLLASVPAHAQSSQFGGCIRGGAVCFGPSATVTVGQFDFSTSKFSGGIVPGVGYAFVSHSYSAGGNANKSWGKVVYDTPGFHARRWREVYLPVVRELMPNTDVDFVRLLELGTRL